MVIWPRTNHRSGSSVLMGSERSEMMDDSNNVIDDRVAALQA